MNLVRRNLGRIAIGVAVVGVIALILQQSDVVRDVVNPFNDGPKKEQAPKDSEGVDGDSEGNNPSPGQPGPGEGPPPSNPPSQPGNPPSDSGSAVGVDLPGVPVQVCLPPLAAVNC